MRNQGLRSVEDAAGGAAQTPAAEAISSTREVASRPSEPTVAGPRMPTNSFPTNSLPVAAPERIVVQRPSDPRTVAFKGLGNPDGPGKGMKERRAMSPPGPPALATNGSEGKGDLGRGQSPIVEGPQEGDGMLVNLPKGSLVLRPLVVEVAQPNGSMPGDTVGEVMGIVASALRHRHRMAILGAIAVVGLVLGFLTTHP